MVGPDPLDELGGLRERRKRTTRRALEDAALRLFARDGYDATTVEAIAAEAEVSPRTFFRYFASKDEVLNPDRKERQARLVDAVRALPAGLSALEIVEAGFVAIAPEFEDERAPMLLRRQAAVSSSALRGRLYDVLWSWQGVLMVALIEVRAAGGAHVSDELLLDNEVAAAAGVAVWQGAITRWLAVGGDLGGHVQRAFAALRD